MSALDDVNNTPATEAGIPALVQSFREADVPHANPPEAAQVLEQQTAPEVAGEPEPFTDEQVAALAKAEVLAEHNAERATRGEAPLKRMPPLKRRTAAVVQVELDAALAEIAKLEHDASIANDSLDKEAIATLAVENDNFMSQLDEARTAVDEQAAQITSLRETASHRDEQILRLKSKLAAAVHPEASTPIEILVSECEARGWKVQLSR